MLGCYVRVTTWLATRSVARGSDDRGALSVEAAIIIGVVAVAAVGVGTGLTLLVTRKVAEWSGL